MILPWDMDRGMGLARRADEDAVARAASPFARAASDVSRTMNRNALAANPTTGAAGSREAMTVAAPELARLGAAGANATLDARATANANESARQAAIAENNAGLFGSMLNMGGGALAQIVGASGGGPGGGVSDPLGGAGGAGGGMGGLLAGAAPMAGSAIGTGMGGPLGGMLGGALGNAAGGMLGAGPPTPPVPFDRNAGSEDVDMRGWTEGGAAPRGLAGSASGPLAAAPAPAAAPPGGGYGIRLAPGDADLMLRGGIGMWGDPRLRGRSEVPMGEMASLAGPGLLDGARESPEAFTARLGRMGVAPPSAESTAGLVPDPRSPPGVAPRMIPAEFAEEIRRMMAEEAAYGPRGLVGLPGGSGGAGMPTRVR